MRISEVSAQSGISSDTLRYYERIGLLPPINRKESGIRDYSELDLRRVEFIKCMRSAGLPIEVLIEYYGLVQQGDQTMEAWQRQLRFDPIPAFLSSGNEALRYFVRRDLLGEEVEPIHHLWQLSEAQKMFKKQQPDGSVFTRLYETQIILILKP